jgi:hypothetical protein
MAFALTLREPRVESDASHTRVDAVRCDFSAQVRASSSQSRWLNTLSWMLEEHATLLYL